MDVPAEWTGLAFLDDVRRAGGTAYAVGGAVRDLALGLAPKDLDVVVCGIDADRLGELLSRTGTVSFVGRAFGVFKWTPQAGPTIDVALPRTERSTGTGHREFDVAAAPDIPVETDLARRDFTVNAIAVALPGGAVLDPWSGLDDLSAGVLRAVGDPAERFHEDPLRILRGAGFVARFDLVPAPDTRAAMTACVALLESVSAERVSTELIKLLGRGRRPSRGLRLLIDVGAMPYVLPEFVPSIGFDAHHPNHHLLLHDHVLAVVDEAARRGADIVVRVAALLHDIAKPETYTEERRPDGTVVGHCLGHDVRGAEISRAIADRLRLGAAEGFPSDGVDDAIALVRHHLIDLTPESSERAWRRWLHRVGGRGRAERLLDLWAADRFGHREGLDEDRLERLRARLRRTAVPPLGQHDLAVDGRELARRFDVEGREIGRLKRALLDKVVDGDLPNRTEDLIEAARGLLGADP